MVAEWNYNRKSVCTTIIYCIKGMDVKVIKLSMECTLKFQALEGV